MVEESGQNVETGKPKTTILVVDDDPFLQKLVSKQLERLDLNAVVAGGGYEAVQYIEKGLHFDLFLLDCQMPGMDGFELSHAIRNTERFRETPIVAITASHMAEKERRDEAGMNDCLSKPFTMEELAMMLSRWLPQNKHSLPLMAASSGDPTSLESKPSSSVLDLKKLQRTFGKDGCIEIIRTFADTTVTIVDDIKQARNGLEKDKVKFLCHRLKGAASMACMRDLSRTSALLEEAGSRAEWEEIDRLLSTLDLQMQKATAALKSALSELN